MIIDAQSHYIPPEVAGHTTFYKVHWSDIERQLGVMDQCGISKSLLLYPTSDAHLEMGGLKLSEVYNQGIASVVKKYPGRFIGAGIIPVDEPKYIMKVLKKFPEWDFPVLSLASSYQGKYLDDELFLPVFEIAQDKGLLIHVHPQIMQPIGEERVRDPLLTPVLEYVMDVSMCIGKMLMQEVFSKFPGVTFIFAHYGGVLPFVKERFDNTYQMLLRRNYVKDLKKMPSEYFRNLYFDTSGSKSYASLLCALEVVDHEHILYASDFPANQDIPASIALIKNADFESETKDKILGGNLEKLLSRRQRPIKK